MRSIRKLVLLGLAALMVCAAVASAASAQVEVRDASTGTALVAGDSVNGVSTNSQLVGTFFGFPVTVKCNTSSFVGGVTANSPTPTANLTSLVWNGCSTSSGSCTVTTLNTPWSNAMMFNSTTALVVAVPTNGGVQISGGSCLPLGTTCTFGAGQTVNFTWNNTNSTAAVNQTVTSPTCGNGTWSGTYTGRTGATAGSGHFLNVV